ncbi:MAG: SMC-Scp complex subunit ScpB [Butyricicoccus pullicaecorum]|nr:SMC-Scp complex subunit ScpB [Butyricicoccus pullicaecorum]MDO4669283.1 SMC-Scp complex subunit ScpB [Butyricicoccus pullicaecorum]
MTQLEAALEAILFAVGDAVPVSRLIAAADAEPAAVAHALHALEAHYKTCGSGIELVRMEDKVQLCTRSAYAHAVRRATESRRPPALSNAALEVLTVIAYRQPVTRAYIEQLRGVDSSGTVASLLEKGMIEPCGHLDVPGRPVLFRTTDIFLRTFGISALAELPELPEWQPEEQLEMEETE